jgi:hypothetical protein
MGKASDKWVARAEEYERILIQDGIEAAGRYLTRYRHKRVLLFDGMWKLHLNDVKEREEKLRGRRKDDSRKGDRAAVH